MPNKSTNLLESTISVEEEAKTQSDDFYERNRAMILGMVQELLKIQLNKDGQVLNEDLSYKLKVDKITGNVIQKFHNVSSFDDFQKLFPKEVNANKVDDPKYFIRQVKILTMKYFNIKENFGEDKKVVVA